MRGDADSMTCSRRDMRVCNACRKQPRQTNAKGQPWTGLLQRLMCNSIFASDFEAEADPTRLSMRLVLAVSFSRVAAASAAAELTNRRAPAAAIALQCIGTGGSDYDNDFAFSFVPSS